MGGKLRKLLRRANLAAQWRGPRGEAAKSLIQGIERRFDRLLQEGLEYHRGCPSCWAGRATGADGRATTPCALAQGERVLAAVRARPQGAVYNPAERDLRIEKLKMKRSVEFRTKLGAKDFAMLRSVLATPQQQGLNRIAVLTQRPAPGLDGAPAPEPRSAAVASGCHAP